MKDRKYYVLVIIANGDKPDLFIAVDSASGGYPYLTDDMRRAVVSFDEANRFMNYWQNKPEFSRLTKGERVYLCEVHYKPVDYPVAI